MADDVERVAEALARSSHTNYAWDRPYWDEKAEVAIAAMGPQLTPEQARAQVEVYRLAIRVVDRTNPDLEADRRALSLALDMAEKGDHELRLIAERGGTDEQPVDPTMTTAAEMEAHLRPLIADLEAKLADAVHALDKVAAHSVSLEAEVKRLRAFPPCCYDGLGNEGRGCQLLTDRETRASDAADKLRAALASLEGEN